MSCRPLLMFCGQEKLRLRILGLGLVWELGGWDGIEIEIGIGRCVRESESGILKSKCLFFLYLYLPKPVECLNEVWAGREASHSSFFPEVPLTLTKDVLTVQSITCQPQECEEMKCIDESAMANGFELGQYTTIAIFT